MLVRIRFGDLLFGSSVLLLLILLDLGVVWYVVEVLIVYPWPESVDSLQHVHQPGYLDVLSEKQTIQCKNPTVESASNNTQW